LAKLSFLKFLTIEESAESPWDEEDKNIFIEDLENARASPLLAINVHSDRMDNLEVFIGSLSLIFEKRRSLFLHGEESKQQSEALEIETFEIEEQYYHKA